MATRTLAKLREAAAGCRGCHLWVNATQTVFGEGPSTAEVMLVGEQPGDQEDRQGHPFVGPSGRLLDEVLAAAGIDRRRVYVTNAVKHFKFVRIELTKRRLHKKPNAGEVRACRPWLEQEIRLIQPRVIVALGSTAAQALLGNQFRVTQQRGKPVRSPLAEIVIATVHPSAVHRPRSGGRPSRQPVIVTGPLRHIPDTVFRPLCGRHTSRTQRRGSRPASRGERVSESVKWIRAAGAVALLASCHPKAPPKPPPPPEVAVVTVTPERVAETYEFSAEVVPYRRVEVRSRIDGIIESRPFTEGATVRRGQVLYRLERVRPEAAYRSALARRNNAKRTLDRLEPLLADHAIAQQDVDNAQADLEAAEGALEDAKKDLDDSTIRAEIDGRVGRALFDRGGRVTGTDDLLTTIDVLDPAYVVFRPSAQQLLAWRENPRGRALIQPGSPLQVQVTLPDGSLLPRVGRLNFVAPSLDATTGTQEFRAQFRNPDRLLVPGQFVRARLNGFTRDSAFAVPQRAVQQALGRQFVYVVGPGDTVTARDVQPGPWSGNRWIIEKGLASGDRVVVDGAQKAAPGGRVRPVPAAIDSVSVTESASAGSASAGSAAPTGRGAKQ